MSKILVCDDSILARSQLKDIIKDYDPECEVIEANNGQLAVELFKEHKPDVVFLDIVMPVKDGISAVREMRETDTKAKIIMASSVGNQKHLKEAISAGANDFVQKPLEEEKVREILNLELKGGE
ncbi:two-component system, chemotaxis family, response regulator CheY [Acetitomaculum ruminis DSM 5522]|uniref:Stage 0 sporulation protein A homolog n=1 Tax=Acetitomaculum ruminis DSM 5522 TaxID=1120918 RepID=A0A1I0V7M6_9FIRM|nr:response regulator [Acetitomaculum ruminis]SFA72060.1 two-component system, chemotaxis family, response regulator CheY [Acetitomaculum ruminis DSM 5522]